MKSTFKQEYLADCNYEISQYILCDDYYPLTKKLLKVLVKLEMII